jgi:tetratricopeptide (TPR) repeat protein
MHVATAWVLDGSGQRDEALEQLRAAAAAEDKTEKHPVTPGPLMPARELLAVMLLERGMVAEALAAFEATLSKEPNRLGALAGAARAAEKAGDLAKARQYYAKVAEFTGEAGGDRPEAKEAHAFLARAH